MEDSTIPKNRTRKRIAYNEFKELLSSGLSLSEMIRQGNSKHQIHFYSILAQGKMQLTKQQFECEYFNGVSLDEISKKYNIQRGHLTQLKNHFGIKSKGRTFIHRKNTEKPLTERQKKIIYGGLMGDASKMSPSSIKMKQSLKQRDYLDWKYQELKEHTSKRSYQISEAYDIRYDKIYKTIRFYTHANTSIETIVHQFYKNRRKIKW